MSASTLPRVASPIHVGLFAAAVLTFCGGCALPPGVFMGPEQPLPDDYAGAVWTFETRGEVHQIRFSSDSMKMVTAEEDGYARVWDLRTGKLLAELGPHGNICWHAPVLSWLTRHMPPWDLFGSRSLWYDVFAQSGEVHVAEFWPDDRHVVTSADRIRLWDIATGRVVRRWDLGGGLVGLSPDGKRVVISGGSDYPRGYRYRVFDLVTNEAVSTFESASADSVAFTSDGTGVVISSPEQTLWAKDGHVHWWAALRWIDLKAGKEVKVLKVQDYHWVMLSADQRRYVTRRSAVPTDGFAVWDTATGKVVTRWQMDFAEPVGFLPGNRFLVLSRPTGKVDVLDIEYKIVVHKIPQITTGYFGHATGLSPNGRFVAISMYRRIYVWRLPALGRPTTTQAADRRTDESPTLHAD